MSFEILHFRGAGEILHEKNMTKEIKFTMEYLNDCLFGTYRKSELMRQALNEMEWRQNGDLNVLDGRRYFYKGFKNRVAMDGSFSSYEYIQDALLKLQVGFDKKKLDMGIVLVTAQRSEKSKLGTTKNLVRQEIEMLHPTINLPITVVLFDLGKPGELYEEQKEQKGLKNEEVKPRIKKDKPAKGIRAQKAKTSESHDKSDENEVPSQEDEMKMAVIQESQKIAGKKKRQPVNMPPQIPMDSPQQVA